MIETVFPWGGHMRWDYTTANYAGGGWGSRSLREVSNRYLAADSAGLTEWRYPITHSDSYGSPIAVVHADTTIADASGVGAKKWTFSGGYSGWGPAGAWQIGLASEFTQYASSSAFRLPSLIYFLRFPQPRR